MLGRVKRIFGKKNQEYFICLWARNPLCNNNPYSSKRLIRTVIETIL